MIVRYSSDALKALRRYRHDADRIMAKVGAYAKEPAAQANNVKRLKGTPPIHRLRIGDYRVLFTIDDGGITVLDIGPRGSIYD